MSQEKVSRYKEEKANRKAMMKKEKRKHFFRKCVVGIVALGLVGWIGYSAYQVITTPDEDAEVVTTQMDVTAITDYLSSLNTTYAE